jgi:hypothetical protein
MRILEAVMGVNEEQPGQVLSLLHRHFPSLEGVRLAVLGLAFKPGNGRHARITFHPDPQVPAGAEGRDPGLRPGGQG